jgi:hypothetical protein
VLKPGGLCRVHVKNSRNGAAVLPPGPCDDAMLRCQTAALTTLSCSHLP